VRTRRVLPAPRSTVGTTAGQERGNHFPGRTVTAVALRGEATRVAGLLGPNPTANSAGATEDFTMRKLVVTLLAALAVMLPALAITAPAQAAVTAAPTPTTATATATEDPAPSTEPTDEEKAAAEKAAAEKAAKQKAAKQKAAKIKAAKIKAAKEKARKKALAKKRAKQRAQLRVWNRLAHCESTSRWFINTGNGYYGGLQISPSTWRAYGGQRFAGLPHRANKAEQIIVGKRIKAGQGWGAWPSCSRRLGLR